MPGLGLPQRLAPSDSTCDRPIVTFDFSPLGSFAQFSRWQEGLSWGPDQTWSVAFGPGVVDHLVAGLRHYSAKAARSRPGKAEPFAVVAGCVPWLTSETVVDELVSVSGGVCIAVDKGGVSPAVRRLMQTGSGMRQGCLAGLLEYGEANEHGEAPVIGPYDRMPGDAAIGPVRLVGYRKTSGGRSVPLLHAKLMVVGCSWIWENDGGGWDEHFTPIAAWTGSANWTVMAGKHLELGLWTEDPAFCSHAWEFVSDVMAFSEPFHSGAAGPEPSLVPVTWDDDAFVELLQEMRDGYGPKDDF